MNIRFEYLYRDAANFKKWGDIVFTNKRGHDPKWLEEQAHQVLIDHDFFVAELAEVPDLRFEDIISHLDHDWHQFDSFSSTEDESTDELDRDVIDFLESLRNALYI